MDPSLAQVIIAVLGLFATGGIVNTVLSIRRDQRRGTAPLDETQARLDIVKQLETEKTLRVAAEHERDDANSRAATAGQRADAADTRADRWERYSSELREDCLDHGIPLSSLRPRPVL